MHKYAYYQNIPRGGATTHIPKHPQNLWVLEIELNLNLIMNKDEYRHSHIKLISVVCL